MVRRLLLTVFVFWAGAACAQLLIVPGPEERLSQDCDVCPKIVTLPNGTMISQAPVTRGEFAAFVSETNFQQQKWGCKWNYTEIKQEDDHPVVCVSFDDVQAYLAWLGTKAGHSYSLPTVAEVQYAAMGGQDSHYWWGQSIGKGRANCIGCGNDFDGKGTSAVGKFAKNPFHLLDAVGNVWIWTSDCVDSDCSQRRLVGGGWSNPPADLRVSKTIFNGVEIPFNTYGIRVVRDPG